MNRRTKTGQLGFTLVEIALVIVIIGVVITMALAVYRPAASSVADSQTASVIEGVRRALITFALEHHRLPCADTNGNGHEGDSAAGCGATDGFMTGRVPYATLGIAQPGAPGQDLRREIVYGVYRNNGSNADLARAVERTSDPIGSVGYLDRTDFRRSLANGAAATSSLLQVYTTGDNGATGFEDCTGNVVANAAFLLAAPGAEDADGDNNRFDGINNGLQMNGSGSTCFASPSRRADANYDDRVVAMSFAELLGAMASVN